MIYGILFRDEAEGCLDQTESHYYEIEDRMKVHFYNAAADTIGEDLGEFVILLHF